MISFLRNLLRRMKRTSFSDTQKIIQHRDRDRKIDGIGNDIIEIARIEGVIKRHGERFLNKIFTAKEQEYCSKKAKSSAHFAGRFAAKEAVVKALGTGFGSLVGFLDIEIVNDAAGKPIVYLSSHVDLYFQHPIILLSISHCRTYATAIAIIA